MGDSDTKDTWVMHGIPWDDPRCLHTPEEAIEYIDSVGFLPLFRNEIAGFSLEERTSPDFWWSGDTSGDPWEWRGILSRSGKVAYGKFFNKKAGFISLKWLPYFVNFRRDGYDFDALWEDGKASARQKKIMDLFMEQNSGNEIFSNEIKRLAGFGGKGEKGFDGVTASLQMETYLVVRDFRQRENKHGEKYGWAVAVYTTPEHIWGYDKVTSAYKEKPADSRQRIEDRIRELFPNATEKGIKNIVKM